MYNADMCNKEYVICEQQWENENGKETHKQITVVSINGKVQCNIHIYPMENVQVLSDLYVSEEMRKQGYATAILNYIDTNLQQRKYTMVFIEEKAPEWLFEMYNKRGYIIRTI